MSYINNQGGKPQWGGLPHKCRYIFDKLMFLADNKAILCPENPKRKKFGLPKFLVIEKLLLTLSKILAFILPKIGQISNRIIQAKFQRAICAGFSFICIYAFDRALGSLKGPALFLCNSHPGAHGNKFKPP